eukprot:gnl/TRDRNA2_/TRDRNA2_187717_c0_seq1.p1 gnl/TRDRNA2_/TRDRNA2_187717_c0~~gnl/TRDRNA2_/TRDRNA2_187717_c0_seq1.p1  ORF type:complete len:272 (-),score=31.72 gnl/TRDRNA2_/TRDRNA2_187717_c0_seq1:358-1173(-)
MQKSASAPVLHQSEYRVPCHGVGLTGHPKRVTGGAFLKDKGIHSSRINQIIRHAEKVPGPGKYETAREEKAKANAFSKSGRNFKKMNATVGPGYYETRDVMNTVANAGKENLSQNRRVTGGKLPKGPRRSFLDATIRAASQTPGPGYVNDCKAATRNKLDTHMRGFSMDKGRRKATAKKAGTEGGLGPNHYTINRKHTEARSVGVTIPKSAPPNFLEQVVREKWSDARTKTELPGPGTYATPSTETDYKISRGTKLCQMRGLGRSPCSGYL